MWYEYDQNNSGGSFHLDKNLGVKVWIEARNADEANGYAESIGMYFDGFGDCPCCGDRWYSASDWREYASLEDATRATLEAHKTWPIRWDGERAGVAHYQDGRIEDVMFP